MSVGGEACQWERVVPGPGTSVALRTLLQDGMTVELVFRHAADGRPVCTSVVLSEAPDQTFGLSSTSWQSVRLGSLLASARRYLTHDLELIRQDEILGELVAADWTSQGPKKLPDELYAALAYGYAILVANGVPDPIRNLASPEVLNVPRGTVRARLAVARKRGLLSPPVPGRAEGVLTASGCRVLGLFADADQDGTPVTTRGVTPDPEFYVPET